jgi:hypothetical protein
MISDMDDYADYNRFIQRIIQKTGRPEEITGKLKQIRIQGRVNLSIAAGHFDDSLTSLCFEALVAHVNGVGQPAEGNDRYDEAREARFIDALVLIAPLMDGKLSARVAYRNQAIKLAQVAGMLSQSRTGVSDPDVVRGFFLRCNLGYREQPDWIIPECKFLGQHFELISERWELFEERGLFDQDFISQLASFDGSKPLSGGVL